MARSRRYSIAEARSNLPAIIDEAEAGIEVELTRRGVPVAAILSFRTLEQLRRARSSFNETYRNFLGTHSPEEAGLDASFVRSLRAKDKGRKVLL